jgi:hypothetical protein
MKALQDTQIQQANSQRQAEEERKQRTEAEKKAEKEQEQRTDAQKQVEEANRLRTEAQKQVEEEQKQRTEAVAKAEEANRLRTEAQKQVEEANRLRTEAEKKAEKEQEQRTEAVAKAEEANRLRTEAQKQVEEEIKKRTKVEEELKKRTQVEEEQEQKLQEEARKQREEEKEEEFKKFLMGKTPPKKAWEKNAKKVESLTKKVKAKHESLHKITLTEKGYDEKIASLEGRLLNKLSAGHNQGDIDKLQSEIYFVIDAKHRHYKKADNNPKLESIIQAVDIARSYLGYYSNVMQKVRDDCEKYFSAWSGMTKPREEYNRISGEAAKIFNKWFKTMRDTKQNIPLENFAEWKEFASNNKLSLTKEDSYKYVIKRRYAQSWDFQYPSINLLQK